MGEVRVVTRRDTSVVRRLLDTREIDNVQIRSRVGVGSVEWPGPGYQLVGFWEGPQLVSLLLDGYNLQVANGVPAALEAFARWIHQRHRHCGSIVGRPDDAIGLWQQLSALDSTVWSRPRQVRDHQRVMAVSCPPTVPGDPHVVALPSRHLEAYHEAAVAMYTEELGSPPMGADGAYRDHVATLMMRGQAFGAMVGDQVVFKADVVAASDKVCQLGGVWLMPKLRGRGLSEPALATVVEHCRQRWDTVCLYVNHHNRPAIRCYEAVGFRHVGQCATILY
ncbi:MAG: GNAT family N-acetyltransferase [Propionibacteriaceae bacterium]|jgi:ribosomal protein S18 acetylase RimI-like enzyme|nr:GNAT family N-acetyltransferase [Propionibacteriaceae bacterium]